MTFHEVLSQSSGIALYTPDGRHLTYSELCEQAEQLNQKFNESISNTAADKESVQEKQLVFILCHQNVATIIAIVAILTGKHVAVLIPDTIDEPQLQILIDQYQPNIIYHTDEKPIQRVSDRRHQLHPDLCLMLSTSGSTGTPKQVKLSHKNLFENAKAIISYLKIDEQETAITSLPLSYSYGLSILTSHLAAGASLLVSDASIMTRPFWQQLEHFKVSSIAGVPYTYEMFHRLKLIDKTLPCLKTMTQAGGKLKVELVRLFAEYAQKTNKKFFVMYGQTEAAARMAYLEPSEALSYPESIGQAIPGGSFKLIDENKKPINETDVVGELVYSGPNVMMGYAVGFNELASEPEVKELYTGDLACRNSKGLYFITGRKSRFLKLFGLRVSLIDIEHNLKSKGYEAACSGKDDLLTILLAAEDVAAHAKKIEEAVRQLVREQLRIHPDVIIVKASSAMPLNANGKVDYAAVYKQVIALQEQKL